MVRKSLFIGRWQPFHDGHKALIDSVLNEGGKVVIAVRDTLVSESNPFSLKERIVRIWKVYEGNENVEVIAIPDIQEVCYGRDVGWGVRRIRLEKKVENISATKIRGSKRGIVWLTGNVGAGKSSIACLLKERLNAIALDGDTLRASISTDLGFSKAERDEHNMRAARLANVLHSQGFNVIVSVIAPFRSTREKISTLINPFWIYVRGGETGESMPYEIPENPDLTIDPSEESLLMSMDKIIRRVSGLPDIN